MPRHEIHDQSDMHFVTFTVVQWIDIFTRKEYRDILVESLRYCQENKGWEIFCWCIMSNHIHLILSSKTKDLSKTIGHFKSFTSHKIRAAISENNHESRKSWLLQLMVINGMKNGRNMDWQLWQQYNHPIVMDNEDIFFQKMDYIHQNPVKAGFVDRAEDYIYSSARDFYGAKGLIDLSHFR